MTDAFPGAWAGIKHIVVVGVEKCGTTTLHAYLSEHPDIACAPSKEIFYFSKGYDQGAEWYTSLFDLRSAKAALDATPSYFRSAAALDRIEAFPSSKYLLFVMRHPVKRAYSFYLHDINLVISKGRRSHAGYRNTDFSFRRLFKERQDRYFTLYADHVSHLLHRFSPERVHCLIFENVIADVAGCRSQLSVFLEMDLQSLGTTLPWRNPQQIPRFLYPGTRTAFETEFGSITLDNSAVYRCEHGVPVSRVDIAADRVDDLRRLEDSYDLTIERSYCEEVHEAIYREDVEKLENLLEVDLGFWAQQSDLTATWDAPLVPYTEAVRPDLALCTLATVLLSQGHESDAARAAAKAMELAPNQPEVAALRRRIESLGSGTS